MMFYLIFICFKSVFISVFLLQDIATLGVVNVRYCGYISVVKVVRKEHTEEGHPFESKTEIIDQPEGGANALNINRFV